MARSAANNTGPLPSEAVWQKYTIGFAAVQTAALTNTVTLFALPARALIHRVVVKTSQAFAGTTTCTLSIGIAGTVTKYVAISDMTTAVTDTNKFLDVGLATTGNESFANPTNIIATFVATVQNLSSLSAGSVDVWVQVSTLP